MNNFGNFTFATGNPLFSGADNHNLQQFLNVQAGDSHGEFTAIRDASPHSDKLDSPDTGIAMGDYPSHSPDHAATSSERDESPDTVSSAASNSQDVDNDVKPLNMSMGGDIKPTAEDQELQRQIFRLTGLDSPMGLLKKEIKTEPCSTPTLSQTLANPSFQQTLQNLMQQQQQLQQQSAGLAGRIAPGVPLSATVNTHTTAVTTNPDGTPTQQKRKRQRRNPVWPYFDVIDGTARCKQCLYSTKSVFSTNLKVHLRSHHRADWEKVIEAEDTLNLNALLLSGNSGSYMGRGSQKRNLPPMTSSIIQTINKLANQSANGHDGQTSALNSALQQALATGTLQQQMLQAQAAKTMPQFNLQAAAAQFQANLVSRQLASVLAAQQNQQAQQQAQFQQAQQAAAAAAAAVAAAQQQAQAQQAQQAASSHPPSQAPTPTPQTPVAPLSTEAFFKQFNLNFNGSMSNAMNNSSSAPAVEMPQPKRRRLRRHPVWMFFKDLEDRMVGCINCNFRTGSAFSTNLKMHLKAHHKEDYAKVLKLEDDMRIEEGILGPPNKMKSELIDFIRGGGNASQMVGGVCSSPTAPRPSPLVQQIISQTLAGNGCQSPPTSQGPPTMVNQKNGATADIVTGAALDEDTLTKLSMGDRLAALVGLQKHNDNDGEETSQTESGSADILARLGLLTPQTVQPMPQQTAFEELRRAAERIAAANIGLNGLQMNGQNGGNDGCGMSDTKTSSSASTDGEENRRSERDRALARLAQENETLLGSQSFKEFVRTLCPEYELPTADQLAEISGDDYCSPQRDEEDELTHEHDISEENEQDDSDLSGHDLRNDHGSPTEIHMPPLLQ